MPDSSDNVSQLLHCLSELHLEEQHIIDQLTQELQSHKADFEVGDRVKILNRIARKPGKGPIESADRVGTVTKVSKSRVSLVTDSGTNTWRLRSNLKRIEDGQQSSRRERI